MNSFQEQKLQCFKISHRPWDRSEILGNCAGGESLGLYEGLKLKVGL